MVEPPAFLEAAEGSDDAFSSSDSSIVYPHPARPFDVAQQLIEEEFRHQGHDTLIKYRETLFEWHQTHWRELSDSALRARLTRILGDPAVKYWGKGGDDKDSGLEDWSPNPGNLSAAAEMIGNIVYRDDNIEAPAFLSGKHDIDPKNLIACENGLLDIETRKLHPHTPEFFNFVSVPFAYDPAAPKPTEWLKFLDEVFEGDPDSRRALQQWFGYILSGRIDQEKAMMIIGPKRSGKGTIAKVLIALLGGDKNVGSPTMSVLASTYGLASLIGKPLAIVPDARSDGKISSVATERILAMSSGDSLTIERKYRDSWDGPLPTRLMVFSNTVPRFVDSSGTVVSRWITIQMKHSFFGREDKTLKRRLMGELPGILLWALEGLDDLNAEGAFTEPESGLGLHEHMQRDAAPFTGFVEDWCELDPEAFETTTDLYSAWSAWCDLTGRQPGSDSNMGQQICASFLGVIEKCRRTRNNVRRYGYKGIRITRPGFQREAW